MLLSVILFVPIVGLYGICLMTSKLGFVVMKLSFLSASIIDKRIDWAIKQLNE